MFLHLIVLIFSIQSIFANFTVFTPMTLRENMEKIPYGIANFGDIPYGKKMTGRLVLADPFTSCKPISSYPVVDIEKSLQNVNFVLIQRGNCTFVQKSYQAQLFGAKMAVIYDTVDEVTESIIMIEDGHGDEINIPTIIIPKWAGEALIAQIQTYPEVEVDMVISFDMWKYKQANYSFWLNIRNRESYQLVRRFAGYAAELQKANVVNFEPRYFLDGNFFIGRKNSDNCYNDGKYCFMDPDGWGPAKGTDMIDEIITQICIYKNHPDLWWAYMDKVDQQCIKPANMKNCGNTIMNELKINSKLIKSCFDQSFTGSTIQVLDNEIEKSRGRSIWPGVQVNNMTYRGNLEEKDILEVICESLETEPDICNKVLNNYQMEDSNGNGLSKTALIILIIVILFCFFLFLVLAYRRWYQKELRSQMDQKVNPMVNQYIAFYETKSKSEKNDI